MTRQEWKLHWRGIRRTKVPEKGPKRSGYTLVRALRDTYLFDYLPEQEELTRLYARYRYKLSRQSRLRLLLKIRPWRAKARERAAPYWRHLVYSKNPFLALLPKCDDFVGKYIPLTKPEN